MANYPEVEDAHVVPAGYLRGFANGQMILRTDARSGRSEVRSVRSVGTRPREYTRERPDGSRIDDIEWSLSQLEDKVGVLRDAETRFPFTFEDRNVIAQFAGMQFARSPRWARAYEANLDEFSEELRRDGWPGFDGVLRDVVAPKLERGTQRLRENTQRLMLMMRSIYQASAVFWAMHWTVIRFHSPILLTSDHPIVLWPRTPDGRRPSDSGHVGLLQTLEVRYPLSSRICLLMTWKDGPDEAKLFDGKRTRAKNINAFTRAQAEQEWFCLPETSPPVSDANFHLLPIAPEVHPGYGVDAVSRSPHREAVTKALEAFRREPLKKDMSYPAVEREGLVFPEEDDQPSVSS